VIRSTVHAATRCALAITILLPEFKLENIACEEGKKRGSLHLLMRHYQMRTAWRFQLAQVEDKSVPREKGDKTSKSCLLMTSASRAQVLTSALHPDIPFRA
jgi:hypothetical protein